LDTVAMDRWAEMAIVSPLDTRRHDGFAAPARHRVAAREARLVPGTRLAFADLHNHSHLSDGDGDVEVAFDAMRDAGLDIGALTDHSRLGWGLPLCPWVPTGPTRVGSCSGSTTTPGCGSACSQMPRIAPVTSFAIRGFEWTSPGLGHMNVWDSATWIDPLHTEAFRPRDWGTDWSSERLAKLDGQVYEALLTVARNGWTETCSIQAFMRWLCGDRVVAELGGGADGLASFNHPGRDGMWFDDFRYSSGAADRVVAMEIFDRDEDYLFEGTDRGRTSPLVECLDAGWRVGLTGVTDEHGDAWGRQEGLGRTGLWVRELSRAGVREALRARRFYATRVSGLRVDATANGVRMGRYVRRHPSGTSVRLDIAHGPEWVGKPLLVQLLGPGRPMPSLFDVVPVEVPPIGVGLRVEFGWFPEWTVLRISDPELPPDARATPPWDSFGAAIAYASPFYAGSTLRRYT
jgi:hypothetical protein